MPVAVTMADPVPPAGVELVDDPHDPRLGDYAALTDAALRKRYEHHHGVLIAEGPNPVRALVRSPYPVRSVLLARPRVEVSRDVIAAVTAPVYVVEPAVLEAVVRFPLHQGVLACGERLAPADPAAVVAGRRRVLVLEGLNDHENLGTLARSARALGVDAVLLGPGTADPLYRRSVRVSMGHVLHLPLARVASVEEAVTVLRAAGLTSVALTADDGAEVLTVVGEALRTQPLAVWLGAEGPGLTAAALAAADRRLRIVTDPQVDSLNVAAAGAIALHALAPWPAPVTPTS